MRHGILVTRIGIKAMPLHWKCRVLLIIGQPGKSPISYFEMPKISTIFKKLHDNKRCDGHMDFAYFVASEVTGHS